MICTKLGQITYNMYMVRKLMRWGEPVGHLINLLQLIKIKEREKTDFRVLKAITEFFMLIEVLFDHLVLLGRVEFYKNKSLYKNIHRSSIISWFCVLVLSTILNFLQEREFRKVFDNGEE